MGTTRLESKAMSPTRGRSPPSSRAPARRPAESRSSSTMPESKDRSVRSLNNALQVLSDEIGWLCVTRTTQESKLFPLAYMLLSFFNAYYRYPTLLRKIEERM